MIVDRYDPMNLFEELAPKLNLEFEPVLAQLDELLDDRFSLMSLTFLVETPSTYICIYARTTLYAAIRCCARFVIASRPQPG